MQKIIFNPSVTLSPSSSRSSFATLHEYLAAQPWTQGHTVRTFVFTEESYTSKASFLDLDKIPVYDPKRKKKPKFSGKRIKRGLYRAKDGRLINADVQGSYNIIRKASSNAFETEGVEDGPAPEPWE